MAMTVDEILANLCPFRCVPKGSLSSVISWMLQEWGNNLSSLDPVVSDWVSRVVANGGAQPSDATVQAVNTFYTGIVAAALDTKMITLNVIAPDNLTAAITPLIRGPGNDPWTNHSFISSDLAVSGLVGNGTTKYLDTGIVPSLKFSSDADGGISWYTLTNTDVLMAEAGCRDGTGRFSSANCAGDGNAYFDCWNTGDGRLTSANTGWAGFMSFNRIANNDSRIYRANNTNAWAQRAIGTGTVIGSRPAVAIYVWTVNNSGTGIELTSSRRLSFVAIHHGLTSAEGSALYDLVKTLRTTFGGGTA